MVMVTRTYTWLWSTNQNGCHLEVGEYLVIVLYKLFVKDIKDE